VIFCNALLRHCRHYGCNAVSGAYYAALCTLPLSPNSPPSIPPPPPCTPGTSLFNRLSVDAMQRPGEVVFNVSAAAQRLWTSTQQLEDVPPQHHAELCSMINRTLRDDAPDVMPSLAVLVRGINVLCMARRNPSEQKLPPAMRTFRGGELPMQHVEFYWARVGQKYRVPGYLATSFSEGVAYSFLYNKFAEGKTPVKWIVEMDARGRDDPVFKCKQVNFVDTRTLGEEEFLFAPYSVFTVLDVRVPTHPSDDDPVVAAVDNLKEEEGLDLAPWY
jgi:hypothetical protein